MLFNSLTFVVFFAAVFAVYWCLPTNRVRLGWLLLASWTFYAAWYPAYLLLFLVMTALNFVVGAAIGKNRPSAPQRAKAWLVTGVVANLLCLGVFKYFDFFAQTVAAIYHTTTGTADGQAAAAEAVRLVAAIYRATTGAEYALPQPNLLLPLGISFYTFQFLAYLVDVYRNQTPVIRNPFKLCLYISFFPHQIAGPILRPNELVPQLDSKGPFSFESIIKGLDLIAVGLVKKCLIADQVAPFVDQVFGSPERLGSGIVLLGVYAYAVQILCDFGGYTDIGRGCARCLGYYLPPNFNLPYLAVNVVDFWRRWHITLSNWLRDYLYISLGGNRAGRLITYRNLFITMALGGLWHGASWNFVIWGVLHGLALAFTRFVHEQRGVKPELPLFPGRFYRVLATIATFHFVCLAWIFFRAKTFSIALRVLGGIFDRRPVSPIGLATFGWITLGLVASALLALLVVQLIVAAVQQRNMQDSWLWVVLRPAAYSTIIAGLLLLAGRGPQQFIYFQF